MPYRKIIVVCLILYYIFLSTLFFPGHYASLRQTLERSLSYPLHMVRNSLSRLGITYKQVKPNNMYTIVLIGDSMTDVLRSQDQTLKNYFTTYYPNKFVDILNYGYGSTNILSVRKRLEKETTYQETTYKPILGRDVDIILLESFGNNPLSQFPLPVGLQKQTETLDSIMKATAEKKPHAIVIFIATIAPSKAMYGEGVLHLTEKERLQWVKEREAYIENHIAYAKKHNIPLINLYEKTRIKTGDGNLQLLAKHDYIHPSAEGIALINKEIAQFIISNRFLPL